MSSCVNYFVKQFHRKQCDMWHIDVPEVSLSFIILSSFEMEHEIVAHILRSEKLKKIVRLYDVRLQLV